MTKKHMDCLLASLPFNPIHRAKMRHTIDDEAYGLLLSGFFLSARSACLKADEVDDGFERG